MTAILLGVLAATLWSLHDLVARGFSQRLGPMHMAVGVVVSGLALLLPFVIFNGSLLQASQEGIWLSLLTGLAYGAALAGLLTALSLGPISLVGPVTATYPALVILWNLLHGLHPAPLQWLAMGSTLVGGVIVSRAGHHDGGINAVEPQNLGRLVVACAVCMVCYAASVILGQAAGAAIGEYDATWISRFSSIALLAPLAWREVPPAPLALRPLLAVGAMGAFDVAGQVAVNATGLLANHDYTAIGIATYGAISTVLAAAILKERVSPAQWGGIALIVLGVAGVSMG